MTLTPFLTAPVHIQIHALAALLAMGLGPLALYRTRRDRLHKIVGYTWVVSMAVTALSSFLIWNFGIIGPFSPIHLLAVLVLWSLWQGISYARAGNMQGHSAAFRGLYWRGLIVAGLFNFLPGRSTNRAFLPESPDLGYVIIVTGLLALVLQWWLGRERAAPGLPA